MLGEILSHGKQQPVKFEVSSEKILTLDDFNRTENVRYTTHDILNKKSKLENLGSGTDTITFSIKLARHLNVEPRTEFEKLIYMMRDGEPITILVGDVVFGTHLWLITDLNIHYDIINNKGECVSASVNIGFSEYV